MRRTSILTASAALLLGACSESPQSSLPPDGAALFRQQNCVVCHGNDGGGTKLGPSLRDKKAFWTRETLAAYIADPPAHAARDERLKQQAARYTIPMTTYPGLSAAQRQALAEHVLALP
jgi:mono/diheme cytochrome c family protein